MLIGNRGEFAIELTPVEPSWDSHYSLEAAAWAGLSIWVRDRNLCEHIIDGEQQVRQAYFVPIAPIAEWIVRSYVALAHEERPPWVEKTRHLHDLVRRWGETAPPESMEEDAWLDAREDFWSRHFLTAGADGAWLPNLALLRRDDDVEVSWAAPKFSSAPRMYWPSGEDTILLRWRDVDSVLRDLVHWVTQDFDRRKVSRPLALADATFATLDPLDAVALYCARPVEELAALLGVGIDDVMPTLGAAAEKDPANSALCQVLRDLSPRPGTALGAESISVVKASSAPRPRELVEARSLALDASRAGEKPEEAGQHAARRIRSEFGYANDPIEEVEKLTDALGIRVIQTTVDGNDTHMLLAASPGCAPVTKILRTNQTTMRWGSRFEVARAVGHSLLDPLRGDALGAASTPWSQEIRRRRSGAFAAELLVPRKAIDELTGGRLDSERTASEFPGFLNRFGVGARTAAFQLYNHRLVSKPFREKLIKLYGS